MGRIGGGLFTLLAAMVAFAGDPEPAVQREFFASRTVQLCYEVMSGGAPDETDVELWVTRDGGASWALARDVRRALTPDGHGCLTFDLPGDGEYGLKTVAVDLDGQADGRPAPGEAPLLVAVIDAAPPEVRLDAPEPGGWAQTGGRVSVKWSARDDHLGLDPAEIETSRDGGATWDRLASGLPAVGERAIDLPVAETPDFRVRVRARDRAGNLGVASLARGLVIRAARPPGEPERFASATLPPTTSRSLEFDIEYAVDDVGTAGLSKVVLWWTDDGGKTWRPAEKDDGVASPFRFRAPQDGTYGFILQAIDNAHRASVPDPAPGTAPDRVTIVDATPPSVSLLAPAEGVLLGGDRCAIQWTATDANLGPEPVSILWSLDGGDSWASVAAEPLANTGEFPWDVPQVVSSRVRVKVSVADLAGNVSEATSGTVTLASPFAGPPRVQIIGVRAAQPAPIAEVRVEKRPAPTEARPRGEAYERGKTLRAQGKAAEARDAFREELAAWPDTLPAANDLGVVLLELDDAAGAVEAFTRAREIDPGDVEVRFNLAGALLSAKQPGKAVAEAKEALASLASADDLSLRFARLLWKAAMAALEANDLPSARQAWGAIAALDRPDNRWRDPAAEMLRRYRE